MRLEFHELVSRDISRIMDYYDNVAGPQLADEFYAELKFFFAKLPRLPTLIPFGNEICAE